MTDNDETGSIPVTNWTAYPFGGPVHFGDDIVVKFRPQLKTLEEHNAARMAFYARSVEPHGNGIACPKCGAQLWDSDPKMMLPTQPPKKNIHCPACDYRGYRLA